MSDSIVARWYRSFRGVDFRGEEGNLARSPDAVNVWRDYKEIDSICTRPGMALSTALQERVYGIFFFGEMQIIHSGSRLYKLTQGQQAVLFEGVAERNSSAFVYEGKWYFLDGAHYLQYDGESIGDVEGYVPTTTIGKDPAGGGTTYEDVNMLTGRRKNSFLADGAQFEYYLDTEDIDEDFQPIVTIDGEVTEDFTVDYAKGEIIFTVPPAEPMTDGQDNVVVEFRKTVTGYRENILRCTALQLFDNRVFFSGNPEYPNVLWHCSLNDPSYVSDLDYYREGMDSAEIKGMVAGNNALWVFREPSDANTTVFYHVPTTDDTYGKIYPSSHSSVTTGCVGKAVNFNDDIIFFSQRGMEGISGDITTEQVVAHRSSLIDRKLTSEQGYEEMLLEEWEGYLLVFIGSKVYLADSRTAVQVDDHVEYEWFYWEMEKEILCTRVKDGVLYLGTNDGVYTLTDNACPLESRWVTPKDKFDYPQMLKTTNKRGCVVEATGDFVVSAKTEKTDFEQVGSFTGVMDYCTCRIKKKKFKDLQLLFESGTRFSLEAVTLECFIGSYIKR